MKNIKCGYPEKEYVFTGEWWETTIGSPNRAKRNRKKVWLPEFKEKDGHKIYPPHMASTTPPNNQNPGELLHSDD